MSDEGSQPKSVLKIDPETREAMVLLGCGLSGFAFGFLATEAIELLTPALARRIHFWSFVAVAIAGLLASRGHSPSYRFATLCLGFVTPLFAAWLYSS